MATFAARSLLLMWFIAMFTSWLSGTAGRLTAVSVETWQIHLCFVIGIVVLTNLIFLIVILNYDVTDGRAVRLSPKHKPTLQAPDVNTQKRIRVGR